MQKFKRVEHYQLMQVLGKGANGLVYKGLNILNGSLVAIKQIFIGKSEVKAIKTQLDLLKRLDHPNVVKFIDAVQKQNKIYMVLQYMQGGSLSSLVRKSPLDEDVAKIYIKQILNGLAFLHKQQVIHRDIKGANILLTKNGFIKLADFGVAVRLQENQKTISAAGSPYWMAPQIISPSGEQPSVKCDIWSLGCTLIQLLTGNPPYHDLMQFPALFRIVEDKHPPLPECSSQCKDFLLSCFIKNPKQRPSAQELLSNVWLKNTTQISLYSVQIEDKIKEQISQSLRPTIIYQQLQKILKQTKNSLIICQHKYFQMIIQDRRNPNISRTNLIVKLIANDEKSIITLNKSGIINQQFDRLFEKTQLAEELVKLYIEMIIVLIDIYCKKLVQQQTHINLIQHHSQLSTQTVENIILHKCIGGMGKILSFLSKDKRNQNKILILKSLNKFLQQIDSKKNSNQKRQIFVQILLEFEETSSIKQIVSLNLTSNNVSNGILKLNKQRQSLIKIKLNILQKMTPFFNHINEVKPTFRKYISFTIFQLLKNQFNKIEAHDQLITSIFICLSTLVQIDFCKSEFQKNGIIFHLSQYYRKIVDSRIIVNTNALQQSLDLLTKFVQNQTGGIDLNRLIQFQRHGINKSLKSILESIKNLGKQKKKQQNFGSLSQKAIIILGLSQKLRQIQ